MVAALARSPSELFELLIIVFVVVVVVIMFVVAVMLYSGEGFIIVLTR